MMTDTAQLKEVVIQIDGEPRTVFYLIRENEVYIAGLKPWNNIFAFDAVEEICRQEGITSNQYTFHGIWDYGSDPRYRQFGLYAVDRLEYHEGEDEDSSWYGLATVAGRGVTNHPNGEEFPPLPPELEAIFREFITLP